MNKAPIISVVFPVYNSEKYLKKTFESVLNQIFTEVLQIKKNQKIFKTHNDIIMFARDVQSYNAFQNFSNYFYLIPDMAHELYDTLPKGAKKKLILCFLRCDVGKILYNYN